jgi:hypothetical protein
MSLAPILLSHTPAGTLSEWGEDSFTPARWIPGGHRPAQRGVTPLEGTRQARNYLERLLDQFDTWEYFLASKFAGQNWFSDPESFRRSKREGVGVDVI